MEPRESIIGTLLLAAWVVMAPAQAGSAALAIQPEPDSGWQEKQPVQAAKAMVVAAHPEAVQAGLDMLERGGNALDAAVAVQMALNVAEPQSSGIGGGGFLLYYDAASGALSAYDGRETAPTAMPPDAFLDAAGEPLPLLMAVRGGQSVGTPGLLRMLEAAHEEHGVLPWQELFDPAIALAEQGLPVSPRLHQTIASVKHLNGSPGFDRYFREGDKPLAVGSVHGNPALAESFRLIAREGAQAFYTGPLADAVVSEVNGSAHPGTLKHADLARYEIKRTEPLCLPYRRYRVCSAGPPASGVVVLQALGILSRFDLPSMPYFSPAAVHLMLEAEKLAFADREHYLADPGFVAVPVEALLSPQYLAARAALINPNRAMGEAKPGRMDAQDAPPAFPTQERPSTTHFSIIDSMGNAVSMTSSIEHSFGSGLVAGGFLLNNQLTDFSFLPQTVDGVAVANRIEGGKRPRSAMSPAMVFDETGRLRLVIGSPGGVRIIPYMVQALLAVLDWDIPLQSALNAPHVLSRNGPAELEEGRGLEALGRELAVRGHETVFQPLNSGLHAITVRDNVLTGAADPRRDGAAMGY
jgi:gamma-glutamyltranspeptidase / glutathione hydrolase